MQPPSSTLADCDPYSFNGAIHILLECTVRGIPEAFEIRWFRENSSGIMEDLGQGFPDFTSGHNQRTSRYHSTELFHQLYDSSFLGKYWCQVINTTADPHQPLMRSNVFTLLAPEDYTYSSIFCSGQTLLQAVNNVTCADLPVQLGRVMPPTQAQSNEKLTESYQSTVRQG